jgi:hypothetical protein
MLQPDSHQSSIKVQTPEDKKELQIDNNAHGFYILGLDVF